jgi:hypothetical protein
VSQSICNVKWVAKRAREAWGGTCPTNLSETRVGDRICPIWDLVAEEFG